MNALSDSAISPVDHHRRLIVLATACAPLALSIGCGGGSGHSASSMTTSPPLVNPVASSGTSRSLPILPLDQGAVDASGVRAFSLRVQRGTTQFRSGVDTPTLGYNGALLGPALRLRAGERTAIRVRNDLEVATTVHWHGLYVPAEVDGGPHQLIASGVEWNAFFKVENAASTCWFHPHPHGSTGLQVVSGLAGLLIVDDSALTPSTLPDTWGVDDLALVLQDKRFTESGQIDYALTANEQLTGYLGDQLLVNGALGPVWQAPRQWVRLRLLNGCNARTLTLRLGNSVSLLQVANEAGLLAVPGTRSSVTLAPGERAEVLVNFGSMAIGQEMPLLCQHGDKWHGDGNGHGPRPGFIGGRGDDDPRRFACPARRHGVAACGASCRVVGLGECGRDGPVVQPQGGMMGRPFTINGRAFDMDRIDFAVPADTVESGALSTRRVWRIPCMCMA